ncbi:MAG: hypothetical protein J2P54_17470 [Bradyrhizobiaceae bacterium]|nr:hypothetical protein [Bradyrhizobiaceae bacterium]
MTNVRATIGRTTPTTRSDKGPDFELRSTLRTDIKLVRDLGLFDYLSRRLAICGTPADCPPQTLAAKQAGAERLMLSVSLAADPVQAVHYSANTSAAHLK